MKATKLFDGGRNAFGGEVTVCGTVRDVFERETSPTRSGALAGRPVARRMCRMDAECHCSRDVMLLARTENYWSDRVGQMAELSTRSRSLGTSVPYGLGRLSNTAGLLIVAALHNGHGHQSVFCFIAGTWLLGAMALAAFGDAIGTATVCGHARLRLP